MSNPRLELPDPIKKLIEAGIVRAPFAALVDLRVESLDVDLARLRLAYRPELATVGSTVHGGAIASLVDVTATAACWSHPSLTPQDRGTTIGFSLQFVAAARAIDLTAEARVISRGSSICFCSVAVSDPEGRLVAQAMVSYKLTSHKSLTPAGVNPA